LGDGLGARTLLKFAGRKGKKKANLRPCSMKIPVKAGGGKEVKSVGIKRGRETQA